jgi:hypothetical protein
MPLSLSGLASAITGYIDKRIEDSLRQTGEIAVQKARQYAPVRTGRLRAGLHYTVANRTLTLIGEAPWTQFQDTGTRYIMGHFFMERALNEAGRIALGGSVQISYPHTPRIMRPIYAHRGGYVIPGTLTAKQRRHVATNLLPAYRSHYRGNARRARLRVGHPH